MKTICAEEKSISRGSLMHTISSLETLLAPKTLWTAANFWGSSGEKYGEKGHSSAHLLLKSLHAAQGVTVFKIPGGPNICLLPIREDASLSLLILFPISSNLSLKQQEENQEKEPILYEVFKKVKFFVLLKIPNRGRTNKLQKRSRSYIVLNYFLG